MHCDAESGFQASCAWLRLWFVFIVFILIVACWEASYYHRPQCMHRSCQRTLPIAGDKCLRGSVRKLFLCSPCFMMYHRHHKYSATFEIQLDNEIWLYIYIHIYIPFCAILIVLGTVTAVTILKYLPYKIRYILIFDHLPESSNVAYFWCRWYLHTWK